RQLTVSILTESGYTILDASTGDQALEIIQAQGPRVDLIVTDVVMPGMNGRELVERVLRIQPQVRVLYISGYSQHIIAPDSLPENQISLLEKPLDRKSTRLNSSHDQI